MKASSRLPRRASSSETETPSAANALISDAARSPLPVTVTYVLRGVGLALLIAIGASTLSLLTAASQRWMSVPVVAAGFVLGIGMGAMHVVAMGAMRMEAAPVARSAAPSFPAASSSRTTSSITPRSAS